MEDSETTENRKISQVRYTKPEFNKVSGCKTGKCTHPFVDVSFQ